MQILILGGTGSIGTDVLRTAIARGHQVFGLARSENSAAKVHAIGAIPISGDIKEPAAWIKALPSVDAVIHIACDLTVSMEQVESHLLDKLLPHLQSQANNARFIYTGGNWLFGDTRGALATEDTPFDPVRAFSWMVPHIDRTLRTSGITPIVVHPTMTYEASGGAFSRFIADARNRNFVRVVHSEETRWPLAHRQDLADLYMLALEQGRPRTSYIAAALNGFPVGRIARAIAAKFPSCNPNPKIVSVECIADELGDMAPGYALDQQLSGDKARRELGWKPKYLDPEGEIALTDL